MFTTLSCENININTYQENVFEFLLYSNVKLSSKLKHFLPFIFMTEKSSRQFIIFPKKMENISRIQNHHYKKPDPYVKFDIMSGGYKKIHLLLLPS